MTTLQECFSCHQKKQCESLEMGINGAGAVAAITGTKEKNFFKQVDTFYICNDCAQEKTPKATGTLWVWYTIIMVVAYAGYGASIAGISAGARGMPGGMMLGSLAIFVKIILGMVLAMQSGFSTGKKMLLLFLAFFPFFGDIALFSQKKKIDLNKKRTAVLKPLVTQYYAQRESDKQVLKKQLETGEAVDPQALAQLKAEEEANAARVEKGQESTRRGNIWYTLAWTAFTVILLIQGMDVYGSGRGYMQLFGSIRLSKESFFVLIAVLLVIDVTSLVGLFKKKKSD